MRGGERGRGREREREVGQNGQNGNTEADIRVVMGNPRCAQSDTAREKELEGERTRERGRGSRIERRRRGREWGDNGRKRRDRKNEKRQSERGL